MVNATEVGFILRENHPLFYHTSQDSSLARLPTWSRGRCFKAVDPVSEGKAKFIAIDEQPNHQIVHLFRF